MLAVQFFVKVSKAPQTLIKTFIIASEVQLLAIQIGVIEKLLVF